MPLLHQNATPAARQFTRVYVWLLWLVALLLLPLSDIGLLPFISHQSVGLFARMPTNVQEFLLTPMVLNVIRTATIMLVAGVLIRPRQIAWAIAACLMLTIIQCQLRGFGHINHAEIVLLFAAYAITWFDFVDLRQSQSPSDVASADPTRPGAPLIAIVVALCFTYSLTGLSRLGNGGMEVFYSGSLSSWCQLSNLETRYFDVSYGARMLDVPGVQWVLEAGYPLITIVEILAPLCLVSKWFRRVFLVTMGPFHIMTVGLMGILFWQNLALYVLLLDISRWLPEKTQAATGESSQAATGESRQLFGSRA